MNINNINKIFSQQKEFIQTFMKRGKIPGLSIIVIDGDKEVFIKNFGYADLAERIPVTSDTLFELGSCSKSFTALGLLQLEEHGLINPDDPVSAYLPWFYTRYQRVKTQEMTLRQLLHHTSGISWKSICNIPEGNADDALEQTVKNIVGIKLKYPPGQRFAYATINYDIIGAVIENVSGLPFEDYMQQKVFESLGLTHTRVKVRAEKGNLYMAAGYKTGIFLPGKYDAPIYRGNSPAAYVISNAKDIARWLRVQVGLEDTPLKSLIRKTHIPDKTVQPHRLIKSHYAMGWFVYKKEKGRLGHLGMNPNFTCEISLRPRGKRAVAICTNSNSMYSYVLGSYIRQFLFDEKVRSIYYIPRYLSVRYSSKIAFMLGLYLTAAVCILISMILDMLGGGRQFQPITTGILTRLTGTALGIALVSMTAWLIPKIKRKFFWKTLIVWKPRIFSIALRLFLASIGISYIIYLLSLVSQ